MEGRYLLGGMPEPKVPACLRCLKRAVAPTCTLRPDADGPLGGSYFACTCSSLFDIRNSFRMAALRLTMPPTQMRDYHTENGTR